MSKRNFILLIIILILATAGVLWYLSARQPVDTLEDTGDGNFFSIFNPFGGDNTSSPETTQPIDISSGESVTEEEQSKVTLTKVSSMAIAGYGVYVKERLKEMPAVVQTPTTVAPYSFGTTILKSGSEGEAVKEIQRFLNNTLTLTLEQDGVLDEEVLVVIKKWQGDHGLTADGVIGAKTKSAMYSSVNQATSAVKPTAPPTEFITSLRYVEKATGNIYQTFADKIDERKFSSTSIPRVYEASFGKDAGTVFMRYLKTDGKTIETFVGNLPRELLGGDTSGGNEIKGSFLPVNVTDITLSPDLSKAFYLFNLEDNAIGTTLNFSDNKKVQVFTSPFTEWLSFWPTTGMVTLTTKPAASVPGYMYALDLAKKTFRQVLSEINGLTTLTSPDGKLILYGDNTMSLYVYQTATRSSTPLPIKTLPEKCVWGENKNIYCAVPKSIALGEYPDTWYQGEISFNDQIWKIDSTTGSTTLVADPAAILGGEEIDGIELLLDYGENYLFFMNKKDSHLWELKLN